MNWKRSYFIVNDKGFFGDYLFDKLRTNEYEQTVLITINEFKLKITDLKDKVIFIKYPNYEELLDNIVYLLGQEVIILLDSTQEKEIKLLNNYFHQKNLEYVLEDVYDFLDIENLSQEELILLSKKKKKYQIIYIFNELRNELNLNPSKLLNFKTNHESETFSHIDFNNLDKNKFPESYQALKEKDMDYFYKILFFELTGETTNQLNILRKLRDKKQLDKDGCINLINFSKEEREQLLTLKMQGFIYEMKEGNFKLIE